MINKWLPAFPCLALVLGAAGAAFGQPVSDLNLLVAQARRFAEAEMAAQGDPEELELFLLGATRGGAAGGQGVRMIGA